MAGSCAFLSDAATNVLPRGQPDDGADGPCHDGTIVVRATARMRPEWSMSCAWETDRKAALPLSCSKSLLCLNHYGPRPVLSRMAQGTVAMNQTFTQGHIPTRPSRLTEWSIHFHAFNCQPSPVPLTSGFRVVLGGRVCGRLKVEWPVIGQSWMLTPRPL